jgi:viologen exporter family transport system permease protein
VLVKTAVAAKYLALSRVAARQARCERGDIAGRVVFFAVILGVFSSLWRTAGEAGLPMGAEPKQFLWYLAVTEWITLSTPQVHLEIQDTIRRGDVIYRLGRPASFVLGELATGLGQLAVRVPVLALTAFLCAFWFTGWTPSPATLTVVLPFGIVAAVMLTSLHVWIGLLAFWLQDVSPVYWLSQKLLFVLGGMMLPLHLYPAMIQRLAALTPFPVLLAAPASFVLDDGAITTRALAVHLALWCCVIALGMHWTFRRAAARLVVNGG